MYFVAPQGLGEPVSVVTGPWTAGHSSAHCPLGAKERSRSRLSAVGKAETCLGNSTGQDLPARIHYASPLNLPNIKSPNITTNILSLQYIHTSLSSGRRSSSFLNILYFRDPADYGLASSRPYHRRPPFTNWSRFVFLFFDTPIDHSSSFLYNVVHAGAPDPAEAAASGPKQGPYRKRPGCN